MVGGRFRVNKWGKDLHQHLRLRVHHTECRMIDIHSIIAHYIDYRYLLTRTTFTTFRPHPERILQEACSFDSVALCPAHSSEHGVGEEEDVGL